MATSNQVRICLQCVGDHDLRNSLEAMSFIGRCGYCGRERSCVGLVDLADSLAKVIVKMGSIINLRRRKQANLDLTEIELVLMEKYQYEPKMLNVHFDDIANLVLSSSKLHEDACLDVRDLLGEKESDFTLETWEAGSKNGLADLWTRWEEFELTLQTRASHFNLDGYGLLESLFKELGKGDDAARFSIVLHVEPGSTRFPIYRARFFRQAEDAYDSWICPDVTMGPPPQGQVFPGRMNTHGVPVFYGSSSKEAAIMETRPHVGGWVAVVRFDITRPISLLDISAMQAVLTRSGVFHENFFDELVHAGFFKFLGRRISRPVKPEDMSKEYLATQAICEYLEKQTAPDLDGILFPSIQMGGNEANYALFRKSSGIAPLSFDDNEFVIPNKLLHDRAIARRRFRKDLPDHLAVNRNEYRASQVPPEPQPRPATLRVDPNSFELFQVDRLSCDLTGVREKNYQFRSTENNM